MTTYRCDNCQLKFHSLSSHDEAMDKYKASSMYDPYLEIAVLCDRCFKGFNEWYDSLTPDDHKRILGLQVHN